jgi:hypothetical protein
MLRRLKFCCTARNVKSIISAKSGPDVRDRARRPALAATPAFRLVAGTVSGLHNTFRHRAGFVEDPPSGIQTPLRDYVMVGSGVAKLCPFERKEKLV